MDGGIIVKERVVQKNPNSPTALRKNLEKNLLSKYYSMYFMFIIPIPTPRATPISCKGISEISGVKNLSSSSTS